MSNKSKTFHINIVTLFPEAFKNFLDISVIGSARKKKMWNLQITDIKKFSDKNKNIDDKPYGGGPGMILKPDVLQRAYNEAVDTIEKKIPVNDIYDDLSEIEQEVVNTFPFQEIALIHTGINYQCMF